MDRESKTTQTDYITLIRLTQCAQQHTFLPMSSPDSAAARSERLMIRQVSVLVSVWPNTIGYWVASLVSF